MISQGKGGTQHSTDPRYLEFIAGVCARDEAKRGYCASVCGDMLKAFPELLLVRGTVINTGMYVYEPGQLLDPEDMHDPGHGHWWLETAAGEIVDPTKDQFTVHRGLYHIVPDLAYIPIDEAKADKIPTGKCPNCGGWCFNGDDVCTEGCGTAYAAYLNAEVGNYGRRG